MSYVCCPLFGLSILVLIPSLILLSCSTKSASKMNVQIRTVAETLDAMKYNDAGAFVSDVRLIFDNARKYNPPKHPIHVAATKLSKVRARCLFCVDLDSLTSLTK